MLRDPGSRGGSVAMHEQVFEGSSLSISVPKNHFPLQAGAQHRTAARDTGDRFGSSHVEETSPPRSMHCAGEPVATYPFRELATSASIC